MARTGEVLDDKYVLKRKIGQGGMSEVWLAVDNRLGKRWAVKEIRRTGSPLRDSVMREHARSEAELMRDLDCPAIPRIVDILESGDRLDIVMDLVSGVTLDRLLRTEGRQSEERVLDWGIQTAEILSYLHAREPPVFYRDLKPSNLILGEDGRIKLVDFGAAGTPDDGMAKTGTPGYAPPEQMAGEEIDGRSDIYSLGITLRQLLDGEMPGQNLHGKKVGKLSPAVLWRTLSGADLDAVIDRCIRKDPDRRWPSSEACREALVQCRRRRNRRRQGADLFLGSRRKLVLATAAGILLLISAVQIFRKEQYSRMLSLAGVSSYEDKVRICQTLIRRWPEDPRGCQALLEVYLQDGELSEKESCSFLRAYFSAKDHWKGKEPVIRKLCYSMVSGTFSSCLI